MCEKLNLVADSTQPEENAVGFFVRSGYFTNDNYSMDPSAGFYQATWTFYLHQGTITILPNTSDLEESVFGYAGFESGKTLWFRIVSGTQHFFQVNGYVAIVTDPAPGNGRNVYIYFAK